MEKKYQVTRLSAEIGAEDYFNRFVDVPRFLTFCRECDSYGHVWSCPPFDFSVEELWRSFRTMCLLGRKLTYDKQLTAVRYDREQMRQLLLRTLYLEREDMEHELFALEEEIPGSLALLPGSCRRCGDNGCTRPAGRPCRDPGHLRHSLESLGGDVGRTAAELLDTPMLWSSEGRLPEYHTLVAALLLP
ncbi:MAG: DUF2284 domain-containing protein [Firmicutes bacterium]|nr:DUF2284 domain-containing protein [Bacillota bacterium]